MSWELTEKGIVSIATNPGPVHSDRIYKTVYPKAAAEFLRVSGFEDLTPAQVDAANRELLPLLGEDQGIIKNGIETAAKSVIDRACTDDQPMGKSTPASLQVSEDHKIIRRGPKTGVRAYARTPVFGDILGCLFILSEVPSMV